MLGSAVIFSFLVLAVHSQTIKDKWHRTQMKNPQLDIEHCGRYQVSMICDPNNILTHEDANQLDDLISNVMNTTKCPCAEYTCNKDNRGYRIAVALVPQIIPDEENDGDQKEEMSESDKINNNLDEASKFAYYLLTKWNAGQCHEDVMIFYSLKDNVLYTVTGQTAREKLRDDLVGQIAIDHRQYFSPDGRTVFQGLRNIIVDYHKVFDDQYQGRKMSQMTPNDPQAVVGAAAFSSLTSIYVLCVAGLLSFLMMC